jgi:CRISPR-associated endonuclease/helicase Cas3
MSDVLLAKSHPQVTLEQHTCDVLRVLDTFLKKAFPKTPPQYWRLLRAAIVFHDLGKAHSEFQKVLQPKVYATNNWNGQRHELLSMPYVQALQGFSPEEKLLIERIVAGHHKTFDRLNNDYIPKAYSNGEFSTEFTKVHHEGALEIIEKVGEGQYSLSDIKAVSLKNFVLDYIDECKDEAVQNPHDLLMLVGAFKHCDHLASAFVENIEFLENTDFQFLIKKALKPYKHQEIATNTEGSVILTAPTGSGKTETAMLWLRYQLDKKGQGRTFYVLPFTASINAMFERLSHNMEGFGESKVGMIHGNLNAVLYRKFFEEDGNMGEMREQIKELQESFRNLEKPLKIVTPFQLLKHLFGLRGFEKGIFEMSHGYFIFDEIHAYDVGTLAQIMVLLRYAVEKLYVKPMIMTATLPTALRNIIAQQIGAYTTINANVELYEAFRRHRIKVLKGQDLIDNMPIIKKALRSKNEHGEPQKVLVVCNTVARAQEVFQALKEGKNTEGLLLHGGFNGEDRARIEGILKETQPQFLVGTQAIEVSLDIDYDVIYTELAPFDALLQRFGRVNRRRLNKNPRPCYVFETRNPKDRFIYSDIEIISRTLEALEKIETTNGGVVDEAILQTWIDYVYTDAYWSKQKTEFDKIYNALLGETHRLYPLRENKETEEDFYRRFDGIKVLPMDLYIEYKKRLLNFNFIGAELLKVQIRKGTFAWWCDEGYLTKEIIPIELSNGKILSIGYWILNRKYDPNLGLLRDLEAERKDFFNEQIS